MPTRAHRCCYVLCSDLPPSTRTKKVTSATHEDQTLATVKSGNLPSPAIREAKKPDPSTVDTVKSNNLDLDSVLERALDLVSDPICGSAAKGKKVEGILTIYVDDAFFTGTDVFKKKVVDRLRKDFVV